MKKRDLIRLLFGLSKNTKIQVNGKEDIVVSYWVNDEGQCGINLCNSQNEENVNIKTFSNSEK